MIKDIDILNEVKARLTNKTDALSIHKYRVTPINGEDGIFINIVPGQRDYDKDNSKAAYTVTIPVTIIILVDGAEEDDASTLNEGVITQLDTIEEQVKNALEYYGAQWGFADVKDLSRVRVRTDRENRDQNRNFAARYITYELKVKEKIADRPPPSLVPVAGVLSVGAYDETTVSLSWTFAIDDTRREELLYQVYYSTADNISTVAQCETNGSTFGVYENKLAEVVTGLTAGTPYYFNVVVKDGGGNKTAYSRVTQTTTQGYNNDCLLYLNFDDQPDGSQVITDLSVYARAVTAVNQAQIDTEFYKSLPGSLLLDGTSPQDYLSIPASTDWDFGVAPTTFENFTFTCWIRPTVLAGDFRMLFTAHEPFSADVADISYQMTIVSDGRLNLYYKTSTSAVDVYSTVPFTLTLGVWRRISFQAVGSSLEMFVDNDVVGSHTLQEPLKSYGKQISIGFRPQSGEIWHPFIGNMDEVGIFSQALDEANRPLTTMLTPYL